MIKRITSAFLAMAMMCGVLINPIVALADDSTIEATVIGVTVTPATASVELGSTQSFSALVEGENGPSQEVDWSVDGNISSFTSISETGELTVADEETAIELTVTATSVADKSKTGTATVTVTEATAAATSTATATPMATPAATSAPTPTATSTATTTPASTATPAATATPTVTAALTAKEAPTVTEVTITPATSLVELGATKNFSALVEGDNNPSQDVTWSIEEEVSEGTSISKDGLLTIAENETAETLSIKVVSVVDDSKFAVATVTIRENEAVTFNDKKLKYAICSELKVTSGYDDYTVTVGDMESLKELDASNWGITDLTGLWTAVNLESLDLSGNPLTSGAVIYDEIFTGIEALTDLKELDLSNCDLGIKTGELNNTRSPWSLFYYGVNYLESLEVLDLSGNHLKADFTFIFSKTKLRNLRELDLSDNELNSTYIQGGYFPCLEKIDISQNYIYIDESQDFYQHVIDIGIDKFIYDDMKNLADLFLVKTKKAGTWTYYYLEDGQYSIDFEEILGDSIKINCYAFSSADTVKVTVNGEKYTAGSLNENGDTISLSGLELGKEYELAFEVMHFSGDSETYTFSFTTKSLPSSSSEDSAGIVDANLQTAVCSELGEDPTTYEVTKADMASLTGKLEVYGVTNAEGIQYATGLSSRLYLYGTYSVLPDLSGITNITGLRIGSPNLTEIPDLSNVKVKTLYIEDADNLVSLPGVTGMAALKTVKIFGGNSLAVPAGIDGCKNLNSFTVEDCKTFDFSGLENTTATSLTIKYVDNFTLPVIGALKSLRIEGCGLKELPVAVTSMTNLEKLYLDENELSDMPQELTNLTKLEKLSLIRNAFEDIPESVTKLTGLEDLVIRSNPMYVIDADLSEMESLKSLDLQQCKLTAFPESIFNMSSLEKLDVKANNIKSIERSMKNLTSLTTLGLEYNELLEFPEGILDLPAIKTLNTRFNLYTDIPEGIVDNLGDTLEHFDYGGKIKFGARSSEPSEKTSAYKVHKALAENGVGVSFSQESGTLFADLEKLNTSAGEITGVNKNSNKFQEYSMKLDSGTTSITLTPTAIYDDTVITVNGNYIENGESIEVPLAEGLNTVSIISYNEYTPDFIDSNFSNTITYNLTIIVGSSTGDNFPTEGRTYYMDLRLKKENIDDYSMADSYFVHNAQFKYDAELQKFIVDVTTTRHSWITYLKYFDASGNLVDAECIASNGEANTATYRMYVKDLDPDLVITPNVVPMGYAPTCRIIFDTDSIIDITDSMPSVDKTDLSAALFKAAAELEKSIYTDTSYNALKTAVNKAKTVNNDDDSTQGQVNEALNSLNSAIDALEVDPGKLANKASLKTVLNEAKAITKGKHTNTAWSALQGAITDAQTVYDTLEATQNEVDTATKSLRTAVTLFSSSGEASKLDKDNLEDGTYTLSVSMIKVNRKDYSMANDAISHNVTLTVKNGVYYITVEFRGLDVEGSFGYLSRMKYYGEGFSYDSYGNPEGAVIPTTVLSYQTNSNGNIIVDSYNDANNPYPKYIQFKLVNKAKYEGNYVPLQVYVPIMEALSAGSGTQDVLMKLDWTTLKTGSTADIPSDPVDPVKQASVDKSALSAKLTIAKAIKQGDYTDATYEVLQNAIEEAQKIFDSQYSTQSEVDEQVTMLSSAINGLKTKAKNSLDKNNLEDGKYQVQINFWHSTLNKASMGNASLNHTALIEVINGKIYMSLSVHPMLVGTITASIASLQIKQANGSYVYADVIANKIAGGKPSAFKFVLPSTNNYISVKVDPQVEVMGDDPVDARLRISWDTLVSVSDNTVVSSNTSLKVAKDSVLSDATTLIDIKTDVKLEVEENVLPKGTTMNVTTVLSGEDYDKAKLALEEIGANFVLYDITLLNSENLSIQPNGVVKVFLPVPEGMNTDAIAIYRINEDGTKTLLESEVENGYVIFYTNHFSVYAIVEKSEAVMLAEAATNADTYGSDSTNSTNSSNTNFLWWLIPIVIVAAGVTIFIVRQKLKSKAKAS